MLLLYVYADSVMASAGNMISMGLDTLEEEEEKARFFAQLEAGASSTIDYSKLNKDLDSTSSTIDTNLRYGNGLGLMLHSIHLVGSPDNNIHNRKRLFWFQHNIFQPTGQVFFVMLHKTLILITTHVYVYTHVYFFSCLSSHQCFLFAFTCLCLYSVR